jgi:hypothetical protein
LNDVGEEPLVNDFAIAFWSYYGEGSKFEALNEIVQNTIIRFTCPVPVGVDYMTYAKENWGKEEFFTFNNYGWFQFSCVKNSISQQISLEQALGDMGLKNVQWQNGVLLKYKLDEMMPYKVIEDAKKILCSLGVTLPKEINVVLSDDPNCHMCQSKRICEK